MGKLGSTGKHIVALDGVRGMAILLVLTYHLRVMPDTNAVDHAVGWALKFGWAGVDLFFVLSGFLITGILVDAKGSKRYFLNFYARRTVRIFPLYYLVVFLALFVFPWVAQAVDSALLQQKLADFNRIQGDEWMYWAYLSNFSVALSGAFRHGILDISWSLAIEEQFYLLWPAVVCVFSPKRLRTLCVVVILGAVIARCVQLLLLGSESISVYVNTISRVDALAVGAWIALTIRQEGGAELIARLRKPLLVISMVGLALVVAIDANTMHLYLEEKNRFPVFGGGMQLIGYTSLALIFGWFVSGLALSPEEGPLARMFGARWLRFLGKYSYAIYLIHLPVRAFVRDVVFGPASKHPMIALPEIGGSYIPAQIMFYVVATVPILVLAWLSWHLYEKHFLKLKKFFPRSTRA
jgi:peptidoglycan/LPS O-acetylase OafA/YrhL